MLKQQRPRRMRKFLARASTLRSIRSASSRSAQTLSRAVSSYQNNHPLYIQPSNTKQVTFWRSVSVSLAINESTGFSSLSPNVNFGFTLQGVQAWLGGTYAGQYNIANSSEFQALFDTYKINAVRCKMFFTNNYSNVNTPSTGMPLIYVANDFDDVQESMTVGTIQEHVGLRIFQFDGHNSDGIRHWVKPAVKDVIVQTDPSTGVQSSTNAGIPFGAQWIDCAVSNVIHNGMKVVYNNQGRTANSDIGSMTFVFEIEYCFKGYR